jgi:hypothetical protein
MNLLTHTPSHFIPSSLLIFALTLSGCGGGGNSSPTTITSSPSSSIAITASSASSSSSVLSEINNKGTTTIFTNAKSNLIASTSYPNGELFAEMTLLDNSLSAYSYTDVDDSVYLLYFDESRMYGFATSDYTVLITNTDSSGNITELEIVDSNDVTTTYSVPVSTIATKKQQKMMPAPPPLLTDPCPNNPPDPEGVDFYPINTHCHFVNNLAHLHPTFTALNVALNTIATVNLNDSFLGRVAGNFLNVGEKILNKAADLANNLLQSDAVNKNLPVFENNSPTVVDPFEANIKGQITAAAILGNSTPVPNVALVAPTSNKPVFNIPKTAYVGQSITISATNLTFNNTTIEDISIYVDYCSTTGDKTIRTNNSILTTCTPTRAGTSTVYFYGGNYNNAEINVIGNSSSSSSSIGALSTVVSSISPITATLNEPTIFTVTGSNLVDGMRFTLDGCSGDEVIGSGTSSMRKFTCTPALSGINNGVVKLKVDGVVLKNFTVLISAGGAGDPDTTIISGKNIKFSPAILDIFSTLDSMPEIIKKSNSISADGYRRLDYQIVMRADHKFFVNFLGFDMEAIDRGMDINLFYEDYRKLDEAGSPISKGYKPRYGNDRLGFEIISLSIDAYDYRKAYVYPGIPDPNLATGFQGATIKNIDGCILSGGDAKDYWPNSIYDEAHYPYPLCSEVGISIQPATHIIEFSNISIGLELSPDVDNCPDKGTYASRLSQSCRNDKEITRLNGSVKIF